MSPVGILLIIIVLWFLLGGGYGFHSSAWGNHGYTYGFGGIGFILIVVLVLFLVGIL